MWTIKEFKTNEALKKFMERNKQRYQMVEVYVNNAYAVEYKPLHIIDIK